MGNIACFDIGGTAIKYGIVNDHGELIFDTQMPTDVTRAGEGILDQLEEKTREMAKDFEIEGISISTPGVIDEQNGVVVAIGPNFPGYAGTRLKESLETRLSLPVEVENDVNCVGYAEAMAGAAKGYHNVFVMTVGTGIGGCFLNEGKALAGASNAGCEVGFMPFKDGFFEQYTSTAALSRQVAAIKDEPVEKWNGKAIMDAYDNKDPEVVKAVEGWAQMLAQGIGSIAAVLNPDAIVLGGGIMDRWQTLFPMIDTYLKERLLPLVYETITLKPAYMGNQTGMMGAYHHYKARHPH